MLKAWSPGAATGGGGTLKRWAALQESRSLWVSLWAETLGPCSPLCLWFLAAMRRAVMLCHVVSAIMLRLLTNPRIVVPAGYGLKALKPWASIAYSMKMVGVAGAFWRWKANWLFREEDALCAYDLPPLQGNQVLLCNADQSFLKLTGFGVIVHLDRGTDAHFSQHGQQSLHPEFSPQCGQICVFLSCVLQNCLNMC